MAQLTEDIQPSFERTLKSKAVSENCNVKFTCVVSGKSFILVCHICYFFRTSFHLFDLWNNSSFTSKRLTQQAKTQ